MVLFSKFNFLLTEDHCERWINILWFLPNWAIFSELCVGCHNKVTMGIVLCAQNTPNVNRTEFLERI